MNMVHCARAYLLVSAVLLSAQSSFAQEKADPVKRMGAYQCLDCAAGGLLTGIRSGGYGRVQREFPPQRRLCVASYQRIDGEQYVFFQLEAMTSKTDGAWTIRRETSPSGVNASGEHYQRITLDDGGWPDGGEWGVKSNSWNAECRDVKAP
jgi:hypothetical protein